MKIHYGLILGGLSCLVLENWGMLNAAIPDLTPLPQKAEWKESVLVLSSGTSIGYASRAGKNIGEYFAKTLRDGTGWKVSEAPYKKATIRLKVTPFSSNPQEYKLTVGDKCIELEACSEKALASGLQTLLQMMPTDIYADGKKEKMEIQQGVITDVPAIGHRGISVDVSRHFQDKDTILKLLDGLATCKINSFQWHLTDDQGWRFPSKAYPKLTENGPSYSVEDIKEVVKRANDLGIQIIPEIDMPGHCGAVAKAYPELCAKRDDGKAANVLNVGSPETMTFVKTVISEISTLIPGMYFHIGADEVGKGPWKGTPECQELMKKEDMKNLNELQAWFVKQVAEVVRKQGRIPLAWDEAMEGGLGESKDIGIVSWRNTHEGLKALKEGHPVIWSPTNRLYFDKVNSRSKDQPRGYGENVLPLHMVYSFCPLPPTLTTEEKGRVMGAQAGLWSEMINGSDHMLILVFPRICALGEALWTSPEKKDWAQFLKRQESMNQRLKALDIPFFWEEKTLPVTLGHWTSKEVSAPNSILEYSLDASDMNTPGYCEISVDYTKGTGAVTVHAVELIDSEGKVVTEDKHDYSSTLYSRKGPDKQYYLQVPAPGKYKIKVTLSPTGEGGCDGIVQMIKPLPALEYAPAPDINKEGNRMPPAKK